MNLRKLLRKRNVIILSIVAVVVIGLVVIITLPSGASSNNLNAKISEIVGVVQVRNGSQAPFSPVNDGFLLNEIMQLQTKEESKVRLDLSTGSIVRLGQSTVFSLQSDQLVNGGVVSHIKLQIGRLWAVLNGGSLDVTTPAGLASVRGSYMSVWVEAATNTVAVSCLEGHCGFQVAAGDVEMTSGQKVTSTNPNTLPAIEKMDQADLQSWRDNCPEAAVVIPQILNFLATSTPTLTLTLATETVTPTPTPTSLFTLTPGPLAGTGTVIPGLTPTLLAGAGSVTPTLRSSLTATLSPIPTATRATAGVPTNTATLSGSTPLPSNTPQTLPTSTSLPAPSSTPLPGASSTPLPAPSSTPLPAPSNTPLPPPTYTPVPRPTSTPVPPPTNTPVPPPTSTPVPYP